MSSLDETDLRILSLLQDDSRLTNKELAAKIHLSPTPTFERVKRLEREGYIRAAHINKAEFNSLVSGVKFYKKLHKKEP